VEDILLILFDFLDPRDIATMAQVEVFLNKFVREAFKIKKWSNLGKSPKGGGSDPIPNFLNRFKNFKKMLRML